MACRPAAVRAPLQRVINRAYQVAHPDASALSVSALCVEKEFIASAKRGSRVVPRSQATQRVRQIGARQDRFDSKDLSRVHADHNSTHSQKNGQLSKFNRAQTGTATILQNLNKLAVGRGGCDPALHKVLTSWVFQKVVEEVCMLECYQRRGTSSWCYGHAWPSRFWQDIKTALRKTNKDGRLMDRELHDILDVLRPAMSRGGLLYPAVQEFMSAAFMSNEAGNLMIVDEPLNRAKGDEFTMDCQVVGLMGHAHTMGYDWINEHPMFVAEYIVTNSWKQSVRWEGSPLPRFREHEHRGVEFLANHELASCLMSSGDHAAAAQIVANDLLPNNNWDQVKQQLKAEYLNLSMYDRSRRRSWLWAPGWG